MEIRMKKIFLLVFCNCLLVFCGFSQIHENQQWISFDAKYKINSEFSADIEQGFRISEFSWMNTQYTDFGLTYKINSEFRVGAGYRFITRGSWFVYEHIDHRFYLDLSYRKKFGDLKITWRTRFQERFRDWHTSELGWRPQFIMRNKADFEYKLDDVFTPYISLELFTRLNDMGQNIYNQQARLYLGCSIEISQSVSVSPFFMKQNELNTSKPEYDNVWGVSVNWTINP